MSATLRVVTPAELMAELARREQEYRHELERLIKTQERVRADLLTWMAAGEDANTAADRTLAKLERQQKHVAGRAAGLGTQVSEILREMEINRMLEAGARRRLDEGVARPLADLGRRRMPAAVERIAALGDASAASEARAVDRALGQIVAEMRRIAANMVKWEGFQEAVTLLRDILELQGEVHDETQEALERKLREIFGTNP